jgi:pimeloyl-ACP methyl ester carboxylesterase
MGTADRDFKSPATEARFVAGRLSGELKMIDGAGHYPHVEFPDLTAELVIDHFARSLASPAGLGRNGARNGA